ncbi:MAG: hypothetical protein HS111_15185 [Kofleriaceae bacterium]|nr:hypothetical protein [Kofleriaceae bacterium]
MSYQHPPAVRRVLESLVPVVCPPEAVALGLTAAIVDHVALTMSAVPPPVPARPGARPHHARSGGDGVAGGAWPPRPPAPAGLAERWFERWERGLTPVERELTHAVGQLLKFGCYEQPAMLARLGYTPQAWIEQVTRRRLQVYGDDIRRAEAAIIAPDPLRPPVRRPRTEVG